jgi:hypothetical protein
MEVAVDTPEILHPLLVAAHHSETLQELLRLGYAVNAPDANGRPVLFYAAMAELMDQMEELIRQGTF